MTVTTEKLPKEFEERVVQVARVSRVVKGGKKLSFRSVVVVGNRKGKVGIGIGKAAEVSEAVRKAIDQAKRHVFEVPIINDTIPHRIDLKWKAVHLFLGPAAPGSGVIAGGPVRTVLELAGIKNVLSKLTKSTNALNSVMATFEALRQLRTADEVAALRDRIVVHPGAKFQAEAERLRKQKEEEAKQAAQVAFKKKTAFKKIEAEVKKKDKASTKTVGKAPKQPKKSLKK